MASPRERVRSIRDRISTTIGTMGRRPPVLTPLAVAALVLGVLAESIVWREGYPHAAVVRDLVIPWTFVAAGLIAWRRLPDNRMGPLMVAEGFAWFLGPLRFSPSPVLVSIGYLLHSLQGLILLQLILSYPTGRLIDPADRVVVRTGYIAIFALSLGFALTFDPVVYGFCDGPGCAPSALLILSNRAVHLAISRAIDFVTAAIALAAIVRLAIRLRRASPAARRSLATLWLVALIMAASFLLEVTRNTVASYPTLYTIEWIEKVLTFFIPLTFLYGLLRVRLARGVVGQLAVDVSGSSGTSLRDSLRRALGDPTLQIALWSREGAGYIDERGDAFVLPQESPDRAVTVISAEGSPLAAFVHDPAVRTEVELLEAVSAVTGLALENQQLQAEVHAQLEEVRASRTRIVEAGDEQRRRVERDLHDGAQQRLVTLSLTLSMARARAEEDGADPELREALSGAADELRLAMAELRELARGIHPMVLTQDGLAAALKSLRNRSPLPTSLALSGLEDLPQAVQSTAYFVASEGLANIVKYANASSVTLRAERSDGTLIVEIGDDGRGGADPAQGSGLRGLQDRVAALGGSLTIRSARGQGTLLQARLPCTEGGVGGP
jgi:signal transduction histidine kinase